MTDTSAAKAAIELIEKARDIHSRKYINVNEADSTPKRDP